MSAYMRLSFEFSVSSSFMRRRSEASMPPCFDWEALYQKPLTSADVEEMLRIRKRMEGEIASLLEHRYEL